MEDGRYRKRVFTRQTMRGGVMDVANFKFFQENVILWMDTSCLELSGIHARTRVLIVSYGSKFKSTSGLTSVLSDLGYLLTRSKLDKTIQLLKFFV
jgi:hypothetical protein